MLAVTSALGLWHFCGTRVQLSPTVRACFRKIDRSFSLTPPPMSNKSLPVDQEDAWTPLRQHWTLPDDVAYLNHGAFGLPHREVVAACKKVLDRATSEPMDFFVREFEPELLAARDRLADFVGAGRENLVFVENATYGMNVVADSMQLKRGDEVVLTSHEYGAVFRIWQRACKASGAHLVQASIPLRVDSEDEIVEAITGAMTDRTRLVVFSHITSATAMKLPAEKITRAVKQQGVEVCIDGPHAPAILPLDIESLDCDYYTAVCHKWISAAHGTGFLYVHPQHQQNIRSVLLSWGRLLPNVPKTWQEEFTWTGTRDMGAYLALPTALDFLETLGLDTLRQRTHFLASYAREKIAEVTGEDAFIPDDSAWYGSMITMPIRNNGLPYIENANTLRREYAVDAPIYDVGDQRVVRTSCYLYNTKDDIDRLADALRTMLY